MAQMIEVLNNNTFEASVKTSRVVLIDFYAEWCGPCKVLEPLLINIESSYADNAIVFKVNIDKSPEIATAYDVMSLPTLVVMKDAIEINRLVGMQTENDILKAMGLI
jgi:thioredoxin 1